MTFDSIRDARSGDFLLGLPFLVFILYFVTVKKDAAVAQFLF